MLSPRYRLLSLAFAFAATAAQAQKAVPTQDQAVGQRFEIDVQTLPEPKPETSVSNAPRVVPRGDRTPRVPEGFTVTTYATGLTHPRKLLVLPNGDVIVAEQQPGWLTPPRDADGDGRAERVERHASGFEGPNGLAWRGGSILVADQLGVWAVPEGANASGKTLVTGRGVFGSAIGHSNRDIEVAPDGSLFVGIGSIGNIAVEPEPKATIQLFSAQGGNQRTFASGLRNPTDLAFHPNTGALWTVVQERDGMGDRLVPDYLTQVQEGAFYGWPYAYLGPHPQPGFAERRARKGAAGGDARCVVRSAFVGDRACVLRRHDVSARIPGRRVRRAEGLVEPRRSDRLQGRARALRQGPPARRLREFRDRVLD